jgi:hypothetical protein
MRKIFVLGDGQVWNVRGIDPKHPQKIFEDLFSGRAMEEKAKFKKAIFAKYIEKGKAKITGMSVTQALWDKKNKKAQLAAQSILKEMGEMAARGIEVLTKGKGYKPNWSPREINYWKDLKGVIIGGGVSEGKTGTLLIKSIKDYLKKRNVNSIEIFKARFSGKEAGFLGSVANIMDLLCKEAKMRRLSRIAAIGVDIGREKIGAGILMLNPKICSIIKENTSLWVYRYSVMTPQEKRLKYYLHQKNIGKELRAKILERVNGVIIRAVEQAEKKGLLYSKHIAVALPGQATSDGYLVGSIDYLPLFRKQDGFHFSLALQDNLAKSGYRGFHIHIINDGIAAAMSNLIFGLGLKNLKIGKYAFLGPGSGLGGCVCKIGG